eukprot:4791532-Amphidinium_carterae.1
MQNIFLALLVEVATAPVAFLQFIEVLLVVIARIPCPSCHADSVGKHCQAKTQRSEEAKLSYCDLPLSLLESGCDFGKLLAGSTISRHARGS